MSPHFPVMLETCGSLRSNTCIDKRFRTKGSYLIKWLTAVADGTFDETFKWSNEEQKLF